MTRTANVLLVDDDTAVRLALERVLSLENFGVVAAANSAEALRGLAENPIDVVLLDLDLGPESGWDALDRLRSRQPRLPVLMMTACADHQAACTMRGVAAAMEKPLDLPVLFRTLAALAAPDREDGVRWACLGKDHPGSGLCQD